MSSKLRYRKRRKIVNGEGEASKKPEEDQISKNEEGKENTAEPAESKPDGSKTDGELRNCFVRDIVLSVFDARF